MSDPSIGANGPSASTARKPFVRPVTRTGPRRSAANFYRSASGSGVVIGGVPRDTVEDGVTAAVRMGYQIAQAQIDRTTPGDQQTAKASAGAGCMKKYGYRLKKKS